MTKKNTINSIIGAGSSFKGVFYAKGSLKIDGKFEGDVKTDSYLIIGTNGKVKTTCIKAKEVTIAGTLIGDIKAEEDVILLETGRVLGNIETPKINVNDGVVVQGSVNITGGQKRDVSKVVEDSYTGLPNATENLKEDK